LFECGLVRINQHGFVATILNVERTMVSYSNLDFANNFFKKALNSRTRSQAFG